MNNTQILICAFDGAADEVDPQLNLIKGGGACLFQEKLVAASAKNLLLLLIIERNLIIGTTVETR